MTLDLAIVADVFRHEAQAKHALEALRQAGFSYDQIGIAMQGHEGIDLLSDLVNLGVPHEQASYYAQEVKAGHTVVSVRPDGREQEAHEIMRQSGALTDSDTTPPQSSTIDAQKAAWEQAVASHQAYLTQQRASNTTEDFHRPRSLRPRVEGQLITAPSVQTDEGNLRPDVTLPPKSSSAPFVHNEVITEQKISVAPLMERVEEVTEHTLSDAPDAQQQRDSEPLLLVEEEQRETVAIDDEDTLCRPRTQEPTSGETISGTGAIDDEDTLRRPRTQEPMSGEMILAQQPLEQHTNRNRVRTGMLVGGLVLTVGASALFAFLRRAQMRPFFLSLMHTVNTQRAALTRRNRNDD